MTNDDYTQWSSVYRRVDWEESYKAGRWDYLSSLVELPRYALIAGHIHKLGGGLVLDGGCGEGLLSDFLDLQRVFYIGFDISTTAITRARERVRRGTVFVSSVETFEPDTGQAFDAIVFNEVIQSTESPLESLERFRDFLTPDGVIILSLFANPNLEANGPRLLRILASEIEKGRFTLIHQSRGASVTQDMSWNVLVIR